MKKFTVKPNPDDESLFETISAIDHAGDEVITYVIQEKPISLYLNNQEIVTLMTIGDYLEELSIGYLVNQGMLCEKDTIMGIDYEEDINTIVVRTDKKTNYEEKLKKKIQTSGCAQGTTFGDIMDNFDKINLRKDIFIKIKWIFSLIKLINTCPSLYLKTGAIHGCVLCDQDTPIIYMEDVGRHNAIDKITGYCRINNISTHDKIFYTTGRLTSEMIIKCVKMNIPILISRSGFTAWGVNLAREAGLTLIGRARGSRYIVLSGSERIIND
ncbi:MAG: formate dehydrogenase accessory sulfurtransferase FdhD [Alphaproteobacteria bacterium]|jgi:FdhD protein|tara:strand:- start:28620 stop:29429 length:810 start_codon:yes stop_codon:yes gene_type:complete